MMALDRLRDDIERQRTEKSRSCMVGTWLAGLVDTDRLAVEEVLADPTVRGTEIALVLRNYGFNVHSDTVSRHRRRGHGNGCGCA